MYPLFREMKQNWILFHHFGGYALCKVTIIDSYPLFLDT